MYVCHSEFDFQHINSGSGYEITNSSKSTKSKSVSLLPPSIGGKDKETVDMLDILVSLILDVMVLFATHDTP